MFGWSYPEAQIATWMSYDTRIQNILQETLTKLIDGSMQETDAEQPTIHQSRPQCSSSDDHILINERKWKRGKLLSVSTATSVSRDTISRNLS